MSAAAAPRANRSASVMASTTTNRSAGALRCCSRAWRIAGVALSDDFMMDQRDLAAGLAPKHAHEVRIGHRCQRVLGHAGFGEQQIADEKVAQVNGSRHKLGKAGQAMVKSVPRASSRASATGPMLPRSVESNVEQYLKKRSHPARRSHAAATSDWAHGVAHRGGARLEGDDDCISHPPPSARQRALLQPLHGPQARGHECAGQDRRPGEVICDAAQRHGEPWRGVARRPTSTDTPVSWPCSRSDEQTLHVLRETLWLWYQMSVCI